MMPPIGKPKSVNIKLAAYILFKRLAVSLMICSSAGYALFEHGKMLGVSFLEGSWTMVGVFIILLIGSTITAVTEFLSSLSTSIKSTGEIVYIGSNALSQYIDKLRDKIKEFIRKLFL